MTATRLEKILIERFGALGAGTQAYEDFLRIGHGKIPKTLEHYQIGERKRYCPKAVAEYIVSHRIMGS